MANNNTYTWQFPALEVTKQQGDYTDVVYTIHWRLNGGRSNIITFYRIIWRAICCTI